MNDKEYLTKEKFDEFKKELEYLKNVKRKEVAESLEYSKALGDLSENAEYHEARDNQAVVEDRIAKLEEVLKNVVIVKDHQTSSVNIGSTVVVENKNGEKNTYTIVGTEESDIKNGKLSIRSPFGQAVLGKSKGESFVVETPNGSTTYKVISIS